MPIQSCLSLDTRKDLNGIFALRLRSLLKFSRVLLRMTECCYYNERVLRYTECDSASGEELVNASFACKSPIVFGCCRGFINRSV